MNEDYNHLFDRSSFMIMIKPNRKVVSVPVNFKVYVHKMTEKIYTVLDDESLQKIEANKLTIPGWNPKLNKIIPFL